MIKYKRNMFIKYSAVRGAIATPDPESEVTLFDNIRLCRPTYESLYGSQKY